LALYRSSS